MLNKSVCKSCHNKHGTPNNGICQFIHEFDDPNVLPKHCLHKLLHLKPYIKLSKAVCKKCITKHNRIGENNKPLKWNSEDVNFWESGCVECVNYHREVTKITNDPPTDCLYKLEHVIRKQSK
jgi:hypothetical protein